MSSPLLSVARRGLSRSQILVTGLLVLLIVVVGAVIVRSYVSNGSRTTALERSSRLATSFFGLQRDALGLEIAVRDALLERTGEYRDVNASRRRVGESLARTRSAAGRNPALAGSLDGVAGALAAYDKQWQILLADPMVGRFDSARPALVGALGGLESRIDALQHGQQAAFVRAETASISSQRTIQLLLLGVGVLLLLLTVGLVLSLRNTIGTLAVQKKLILDAAGEGIFGIDADGRLTYMNLAASRMTGWKLGEAKGRSLHDLIHHTRPDGTPYPESECKVVELLKEGASSRGHDETFWRRDGTSFPAECIRTPILQNGKPVGGVLLVQDVTERRRLETQLQHAQKMDAVGKLAAGIAHDFNNLLTAIGGYAMLLLTELPSGDAAREDVDEIRRAADRAAELTKQLLAFGRRQVVQPRPIDVNELVGDLHSMLRRLIGEHIELVTVLEDRPLYVHADPGQIEQVIVNLAVNARDAVGGSGKVTISTGTDAGTVVLSVSDTGCGMDEQTLSHLFEPFFTTKKGAPGSDGQGTGLGLSTVYGIVRQSGGTIDVKSELGAGSEFAVLLPEVCPVAKAAPVEPEVCAVHGNETVLVVEDEDLVRSLTTRILRERGYKVLEAAYGTQAVEVVEQHDGPIHLTLTDYVLPGMSGREVAEKVSQIHPETKILYMSGYSAESLGSHVVAKPFKPVELIARVRETLDKAA